MPKLMPTNFDFYEASKKQRYDLIGTYFIIKGFEYVRNFPVKLTLEGSYYNYNKREGVITLSDNTANFKANGRIKDNSKYIKVGTWTIDDGWDSISYYKPTDDFEEISAFIMKLNKFNVTYREIFEAIYNKFGGDRDF